MASSDTRARIQALRRLLEKEKASTQEELREALEKLDFEVNQSTVSRDLRRLGAIKMTDRQGRTTYQMNGDVASISPYSGGALADHVLQVRHNGAMIVVATTPGSASLVARHLDQLRSDDILGTVAGDDTVFVAPAQLKGIGSLVRQIEDSFEGGEKG